MKKSLKIAITAGSIILIIVLLVIIKTVAQNIERVPSNPDSLVGNTAGNLYNNGFFAEADGKVYFANAYDNNSLYSMNPDQSDIEKVAAGDISMINVLGDFIYYYSASSGDNAGLGYVRNGKGIYRSDLKGKKIVSIVRTSCDSMLCAGNTIYFTDFADSTKEGSAVVALNSISLEGENQTLLLEDHIKLGGFYGSDLYYAGVTGNHFLYRLNGTGGQTTKVSDANMYLPTCYNDEVYYLDLDDEYKLKALSLTGGQTRTVVNERIDSYNLYNGIIYYQNCNPDDYALKRCNCDGSATEVVKYGVYTNISITSTYVYFTEFGNEVPVYYTPTAGSLNVKPFDNALNAVL